AAPLGVAAPAAVPPAEPPPEPPPLPPPWAKDRVEPQLKKIAKMIAEFFINVVLSNTSHSERCKPSRDSRSQTTELPRSQRAKSHAVLPSCSGNGTSVLVGQRNIKTSVPNNASRARVTGGFACDFAST